MTTREIRDCLDAIIKAVKLAKAEKAFDAGVPIYGSVEERLRSLDCKTREEAISMLALVQSVRIFKVNGKFMVE